MAISESSVDPATVGTGWFLKEALSLAGLSNMSEKEKLGDIVN